MSYSSFSLFGPELFGLGFMALGFLGIAVDTELTGKFVSVSKLFDKHVDNPGQGRDEVEDGEEGAVRS